MGVEIVEGVVEDETELVGRESVEGGDTSPTEKGGDGDAYEETDKSEPPAETRAAIGTG